MLKWITITLIAVVAFVTVLLSLGYLLKEHEVATTQLKQQLDQERAELQAKEARKQKKFEQTLVRNFNEDVAKKKRLLMQNSHLVKQKILLENLTCSSKSQCVLVNIRFADLQCKFAINTIGASLLAKTGNDLSTVGECPPYPKNSELSCQHNVCSYGSINE